MQKAKSKIKGFTLIELLIVITIIGVLAASLFIGLNPIEQINKGRDTGLISKAKEVVNACERYYIAKNTCPGNCVVMAPPFGSELRNSAACTGVILGAADCAATGQCRAHVTVRSQFYKTTCGDATCTVPTELSGLL